MLTLEEYNKIFDLIMKIKIYGSEDQRDAAHALLMLLKEPEQKKKPMSDSEIREYYREMFGFSNE